MNREIPAIFEKYLQNKASEEDVVWLVNYFQIEGNEADLRALILQYLYNDEVVRHSFHEDSEERLDLLYEKLSGRLNLKQESLSQGSTKQSPNRLYRLQTILTIAAAVALIILGVYFFSAPRPDTEISSAQAVVSDVAPGSVGATLTLANGKKIKLSDATHGELAKEAGVTITKSEDGQIVYEIASSSASAHNDEKKVNTLSTASGETYKLRLPDGSFVWLNSASRLTYSANLIENAQRRVKLQGEGYFEVAKDKKHPFIVQTDKQVVEVLGTHFNVNAYEDEVNLKTTLLEGSIRIETAGSSKILRPGQQSTTTGQDIQTSFVDTEAEIAWKNGDFNFSGQPLKDLMRNIARWYDVQIDYKEYMERGDTFSGVISRSRNLSAILKMLEKTNSVKFRIEGKRIYVIN